MSAWFAGMGLTPRVVGSPLGGTDAGRLLHGVADGLDACFMRRLGLVLGRMFVSVAVVPSGMELGMAGQLSAFRDGCRRALGLRGGWERGREGWCRGFCSYELLGEDGGVGLMTELEYGEHFPAQGGVDILPGA